MSLFIEIPVVLCGAGACAMGLGYLGSSYWLLLYSYLGMLMFYVVQWQCYVTGKMYFGQVDILEAQFIMIAIFFFSAYYGTQVWNCKVMNDFARVYF